MSTNYHTMVVWSKLTAFQERLLFCFSIHRCLSSLSAEPENRQTSSCVIIIIYPNKQYCNVLMQTRTDFCNTVGINSLGKSVLAQLHIVWNLLKLISLQVTMQSLQRQSFSWWNCLRDIYKLAELVSRKLLFKGM